MKQTGAPDTISMTSTMFCESLGLPKDTVSAVLRTRLNGDVLADDTKCEKVDDGGHWQLGHEVKKNKDGTFQWITWTVYDGIHVVNFRAKLSDEGKLMKGIANCFASGWMKLDQDYVDELIVEMNESELEWDEIETSDDKKHEAVESESDAKKRKAVESTSDSKKQKATEPESDSEKRKVSEPENNDTKREVEESECDASEEHV